MDYNRVLIYSPQDVFLRELKPDLIFERSRTETVNGEHSMSITTAEVLQKAQRVLTVDTSGKWREYVVMGEDAEHSSGIHAVGTYFCISSAQSDLTGTTCTAMPGTSGTPATAGAALAAALSNTARWQAGTVTVATTGSASMWRMSAWEALGVLTDVWGGEIEPRIVVDGAGVISRYIDYFASQGSTETVRRFDYTRDLVSIGRVVEEQPTYCRIIPLGRGEETASGGYGRKITIETVNDGKEYLQNDNAAQLLRLPVAGGGYEYPTCYAENTDCETPAALKAWGLSVLADYTEPKVTYKASVLQLEAAGMSVQGLALGDAVDIVDRQFTDDGLRIHGRVLKLVTDELNPKNVDVTLGNLTKGLPGIFDALTATVNRTRTTVEAIKGGTMTTADYLNKLIERINKAANNTGGYTYITEGEGLRTYDVAVSDPLVGAEANSVVEIKGGTIRIANSKDAQGQWVWRTVFTSGHIAADMVTTAHLTAGYIGNAQGDFFIDLDNNIFRMPATSVGSTQLLDDTDVSGLTKVAAFANRYFSDVSNTSITPGFYPCTDPPISGLTTMQRYIISTAGNTYKDLVFYNSSQDAIEYEDGETYTVSCYARVVNGTKAVIEMRCTALGVINRQGNIEITNTDWAQYHWTAKANAALGQFKLYVGVHGTYAATVEICGIKCERGSNATDWMPSVADLLHSMATAADAAVDAQTQSDIFNKLTDNGVIQGLYMDNGQLYVNSEYINTAALISPKVGNSATEYARIGSFQYNNLTYSGIEFFINGGNQATLVYGVSDIPAGQSGAGTYVIIGVGYEGGFWPIYLGTNTSGGTFVLRGLPVKKADGNFISPQLRMTAYGVYADYDTVSRTLATF